MLNLSLAIIIFTLGMLFIVFLVLPFSIYLMFSNKLDIREIIKIYKLWLSQ